MTRKICVVTGSRAEYGLLYWIMREIAQDPQLTLQLIVSGMHLSPEFGLTYRDIEQDGFQIDEKVEMLLSSDTATGIAKSIGLGTIGFADAFARLQPDIVLLLGDRFEALAAAQAAMVARIPIAHLHGGEATEGAIDEAIRHAITKMSHIHFVAADAYRRRVIQLGEQPERVHTVGAPGLDHIRRLKLLSRDELEESLNFHLGEVNFLVTYHPVTLNDRPQEEALQALLNALDEFPRARIIITYPNADTHGRVLIDLLRHYAEQHRERVFLTPSLGQLRYLSLLQFTNCVIGNSSSGLIEVPSFKTATVNIGQRQRGRLRAESVIDCGEQKEHIQAAINTALSPSHREICEHIVNPYGNGQASSQVVKIIKDIPLESLIVKRFRDLEV